MSGPCASWAPHASRPRVPAVRVRFRFTEPVSVTQVGDTAWVAEGKLSFIIGDNKGKNPGPFMLTPVVLPK
jgi:hypothetical protein